LTLALVMFVTSMGFAVDLHYCKGQLKSFSFLGKAETCHEMSKTTPAKSCPMHAKLVQDEDGCSMEMKDCCDNKVLYIQSDQDQKVPTYNFEIDRSLDQFVVSSVLLYFNEFLGDVASPLVSQYKPPLLLRDVLVLIQSFLL